ncbi:hypothetical protein Syun_025871 [Stephania yunnanensis]|uniref:Uncharacterized protein n=1 Tax=Stephania yunnanensis TaxID=152371 RepID=A0AAP0ESI0_9MAGN
MWLKNLYDNAKTIKEIMVSFTSGEEVCREADELLERICLIRNGALRDEEHSLRDQSVEMT